MKRFKPNGTFTPYGMTTDESGKRVQAFLDPVPAYLLTNTAIVRRGKNDFTLNHISSGYLVEGRRIIWSTFDQAFQAATAIDPLMEGNVVHDYSKLAQIGETLNTIKEGQK